MSDQNRDFQNQNGGYPNYGQPNYYQAPQGQPMPQAQPMYYQAPQGQPVPQAQPMYYQAPQGQPVPQAQPMYYQAPQGQPVPQAQPMYYQAPQGQPVPQAQPMYYQAPQGQPVPQAQPMPYVDMGTAIEAKEPEVILQTPTFEDYGFSANDDLNSSHDFGGFMSDDNTLATEPGENIFNAPTPNLDISDVEANAGVKSETDTAMFNTPTPNLDINSVEKAANTTTQEDAAIFSNPMPVIPVVSEPTVAVSVEPESNTVGASAAGINFMASMQSMFSSMTGEDAPVPTMSTTTPVTAEPVVSDSPSVLDVKTVEAEPVQAATYQQPDMVVTEDNTNSNTIQDISSTTDTTVDEKGPEYWAYMNQLLNNFDDGQVHGGVSGTGYTESGNPTMAAGANDLPYAPAATPIAVEPETTNSVVSESAVSAPVVNIPFTPAAPVEPAAPVQPVPVAPISDDSVTVTTQATPPVVKPVQNLPFAPTASTEHMENSVAAQQPPKGTVIRDVSSVSTTAASAEYIETPVAIVDDLEPQDVSMPEDIDNKTLKQMEKAKKAEEKAAAKAAKVEAKAAAKAEKAAAKAAKRANADADLEEHTDLNVEGDYDDTQETSKVKRIIGSIFPKKGDPTSEIIRKIVLVVAAVVFIGCMVKLGLMYVDTHKNQKAADELSTLMASAEASESDWSTIYNKYPDVTFPVGMQTKFADLYAINSDLVGWIRIAGLGIDYPVVQTEDDSYYLKRDFKHNKSDYGTVFVGAANNVETLDQNTVVYGHSMRRDTQMFTALKEYKSIEGFKANPIIEFNTLYDNYKFKVYAVFISNGSTAGDDGYVFQYTTPNLAGIESFAGFIDQLNQRTLYYTGVDIQPDDKLITLSTCTYEFDNARFVVVGRMVRDGESEEVDVSKASVNSNPRYPQAWYDENGQTNPYQTYAKWVPTVA